MTANGRLAFLGENLPFPDGTFDAYDRIQLLGEYPFYAVPTTTPETAVYSIIPILENQGML
jgi:hypothetical protein